MELEDLAMPMVMTIQLFLLEPLQSTFEKHLILPSDANVTALVLDIDYDDAFVAYINGVEIARSSNLPEQELTVAPEVNSDHEAQMYTGGSPDRFIVDHALLTSGYNTLAVQIINISNTSSDLSGRVFLSGKFDGSTTLFHQTPSWFQEPTR